jgi:antitoxin component YwqK of YwqJK toxin-antitoxin module
VKINNNGDKETILTFENGNLSGGVFSYREDGYYAKGYCVNNSCQVSEYYPDGVIFQEYTTGMWGMFVGERVVYSNAGKMIYRASYSMYKATDENVLRYCSGRDGVFRAAVNGYIEVKESEECW